MAYRVVRIVCILSIWSVHAKLNNSHVRTSMQRRIMRNFQVWPFSFAAQIFRPATMQMHFSDTTEDGIISYGNSTCEKKIASFSDEALALSQFCMRQDRVASRKIANLFVNFMRMGNSECWFLWRDVCSRIFGRFFFKYYSWYSFKGHIIVVIHKYKYIFH